MQNDLQTLLANLPPAVRDYLRSERYSSAANRLMQKYGLHVDQGAVLERELMLLLLGTTTPPEFAATLEVDGNIQKEVVMSILTDLNQEVFVPL